MSDMTTLSLLFLPLFLTDYFWTGGKFADDARHDDWSRGVLFSP